MIDAHQATSDSLYHRLFAYPEMVADLLTHFLDPILAQELEMTQIKRLNTKFTAHSGQRRRGDMVWEIPIREGGELFILLILEFQSKIDEWMILRMNVYTGLLYQQLIKERKLKPKEGLPPILPILLYNGDTRWNAPTNLRELIRLPKESPLWPYQPEMRYYTIDEGRFPFAELSDHHSLTALFFQIEHPISPESILKTSQKVISWFANHPDGPPVKQLFRELLIVSLMRMEGPNTTAPIPEDLEEVVNMLATHVEKWSKSIEQRSWQLGLQEGRQEGRQEGWQEGRQEYAIQTLLTLLQRRFGPTPEWITTKLSEVDLDTLAHWTANILDAQSLQDVFE